MARPGFIRLMVLVALCRVLTTLYGVTPGTCRAGERADQRGLRVSDAPYGKLRFGVPQQV